MSDTDVLTLATAAVKMELGKTLITVTGPTPTSNERIDDVSERVARAALEAAGALGPGAQPNPTPNLGPSCHDLVVAMLRDYWDDTPARERLIRDLQDRRNFGLRKYGVLLQPHNGRVAVVDAYAEVQDLVVYLHQHYYEVWRPDDQDGGPMRRLSRALELALDLAGEQLRREK